MQTPLFSLAPTILATLLALGSTSLARAAPGSLLTSPVACENIQLSADELACSLQGCSLIGNAEIKCQQLSLRADKITLNLGRERQFAGAKAEGNAILINQRSVLKCKSLTLTEDQLIGRVEDATLEVRESPDAQQRRAVFHGTLHRENARRIQIEDADFTLCDCGPDSDPSWLIKAGSVDVDIDERATLWWPKFAFNPPGIGMVTLPLPTPALSIPIARRAAGFLAPMVQVLTFPYPTLDLPFFLPLGQSYDLTLSPGLRTDWSAPRAGLRFRYAPQTSLSGEFGVAWTHDGRSETASALSERIALKAAHHHEVTERIAWHTDLVWVSDDLYQRDFSVSLQDQVARYLPSRTQLTWQHPLALAELRADFLTHLDNGSAQNPSTYANASSDEMVLPQRTPSLLVTLLPLPLGYGVSLVGDFAATRYGAWSPRGAAPTVHTQTHLRLDYHERFAFVDISSSAGLDAKMASSTSESIDGLTPTLALTARAPMARRFGPTLHLFEPYVSARSRGEGFGTPLPVVAWDENTWETPVHQVALGLDQSLYTLDGGEAPIRMASLDIAQLVDLETRVLSYTRAQLHLRPTKHARTSISASLNSRNGEIEEISANATILPTSTTRLSSEYARWSPDLERFMRGPWTLYAADDVSDLTSGPLGSATNSPWVHGLRLTAAWRLPRRLSVTYSTDILLQRPETTQIPATDEEQRPYASYHSLYASYDSPCDCWGIDVVAQVRDPRATGLRSSIGAEDITIRLELRLGGLQIGESSIF